MRTVGFIEERNLTSEPFVTAVVRAVGSTEPKIVMAASAHKISAKIEWTRVERPSDDESGTQFPSEASEGNSEPKRWSKSSELARNCCVKQ